MGFPVARLGQQGSQIPKSDTPTPASTSKSELPLGAEVLGFPTTFLKVQTPSASLALVPSSTMPRPSPASTISKVSAACSSSNLPEQVHDDSCNDEELLAAALRYKADETNTPKKVSRKVKKSKPKQKAEKKVKAPENAKQILNIDRFKVSSIDLRSG